MKIIFYFFVFTLCFNSFAQYGDFNPEEFDSYVQQAVKDWDVPGLAVAVVNRDSILFINGYGVRELGKREPVDTETLFAAASTTKAFTAAAVGILVDEGKLNWDDPVVKHLPEFRLKDPYLNQMVTVRDLLTHRAGLPNTDFLWLDVETSTEEILKGLEHAEATYPLRSGFIYQNIMYVVAGEVIEAVSGKPWGEFVKARIIEPLQMNRSFTSLSNSTGAGNRVRPHSYSGEELIVTEDSNADRVGAAGSIWTNVEDMSLWLRFLLRGCETAAGDQLLEKGTCEELFKPQTILPESLYPTAEIVQPHWNTYGLGWFQHDYEGRKVDLHSGTLPGTFALAGMIKDENIAVTVLGNSNQVGIRHALMYRLFDHFDQEAPRDWSRDLKKVYDRIEKNHKAVQAKFDSTAIAERVLNTKPTLPLDSYTGIYTDPLFGKLEVTIEGNQLRIDHGVARGRLEHWHYNTFRLIADQPEYSYWRPLVDFDLNYAGKPEGVTLTAAMWTREFTKLEEEKN